jgi:hypothetical protein
MDKYLNKYISYKNKYKVLKKEVQELEKNKLLKSCYNNMSGGGDKDWYFNSLKTKTEQTTSINENKQERKENFINTIDNLIALFS